MYHQANAYLSSYRAPLQIILPAETDMKVNDLHKNPVGWSEAEISK